MAKELDAWQVCRCMSHAASIDSDLDFAKFSLKEGNINRIKKNLEDVKGDIDHIKEECGIDLFKTRESLEETQKEFKKFIKGDITEREFQLELSETSVMLFEDLEDHCKEA